MSTDTEVTTMQQSTESQKPVVPAGYKRTEVGVIPEDWNIYTINQLFNFLMTASNPRSELSDSGHIAYIHYGDIHTKWSHYIDFAKAAPPFLGNKIKAAGTYLQEGDLILADASEDEEGIGKSIEVKNIGVTLAISGLHTILLRPKNKRFFIQGFKGYLFNNDLVKEQFRRLSTGLKVFGISKSSLKKVFVPIPPLSEQHAIAKVLSDTDKLIETLDKLIAKKRAVKQGAVQELLKPKKHWVTKKLGEIAVIKDGTHQTPEYKTAGIPFYSVENVSKNDFRNTKYISRNEHNALSKGKEIKQGDVLMTRIGSIGICKYVSWNEDASFYVSLALLKMKKGYSGKFLEQLSHTSSFKNEVDLNSLQSAIPQKINLGAISNVSVCLPQSIEEQNQIATVLSDMDTEIQLLERRREKTQQLKQGLMQQLLTGKVRLVENKEKDYG